MGNFFLSPLKGTGIASAGTITLPTDGDRFDVSGTTGITVVDTSGRNVGARFYLQFAGAVTLTHDGSALKMRGAVDYTTVAGDTLLFEVIGTNQVAQVVLANNGDGGGGGGAASSGARVHNSTDITLTNSDFTTITFDTEEFDTDGYHDTGTNPERLTVPEDGLYILGFHVTTNNNSTGQRQIRFIKNGSDVLTCDTYAASEFPGGDMRRSAGTMFQCTAGDYFTVDMYQDGGSVIAATIGIQSPAFWIAKV